MYHWISNLLVCLSPPNGTADPYYLVSMLNSWNSTNKVHFCVSFATTAHYSLSGSRWKGENRLILFQYRPKNPKQTKPRRRWAPNCEADVVHVRVNQFSLTIVKIKNRLGSSTTGGVTKILRKINYHPSRDFENRVASTTKQAGLKKERHINYQARPDLYTRMHSHTSTHTSHFFNAISSNKPRIR
jgi:hypothetical protein